MESTPFQALSAIEESRHEMLCNAARALLEWDLSVEVVVEITGLPKEDVDALYASRADTDATD
jgi:hypothetical protein